MYLFKFTYRLDTYEPILNRVNFRYRFSKHTVEDKLIPLLYPNGRSKDNRGLPFTEAQVVCSTLHMLGGNNLLRVEGKYVKYFE